MIIIDKPCRFEVGAGEGYGDGGAVPFFDDELGTQVGAMTGFQYLRQGLDGIEELLIGGVGSGPKAFASAFDGEDDASRLGDEPVADAASPGDATAYFGDDVLRIGP